MSPIAISYPAAIVSDYGSYSYYDIILIMTSFARLAPTALATRNPCLSPIAISSAAIKPAIL